MTQLVGITAASIAVLATAALGDLVPLLKDLGLPVALLLYFMAERRASNKARAEDNEKREARLGSKLDRTDDFVREKLLSVIEANSVSQERTTGAINRLATALEERPCLADSKSLRETHGC